jgi:YVTN family beta-propeller protein
MFIKKLFKVLIPIFGVLIIQSCIPDRMPTEPTENTRPKFVKFEFSENSNLAIPLNQQIKMYFNEKMDLNTFPSNVTVESVDGKINGKFSYASESDTVVIFTPGVDYNRAEIYTVKVHGGVRDINHNSMISPNDDDIPETTWFFTEGDYSLNGFPLVFVRDKAKKQIIYRSGNLNKYIDSLYVNATTEDYQTAALEFSPTGNYLWMVNLKTSDGTVTLIDPETFSVQSVIPVGLGPTNVGFNENYAYVCNTSGKSFSVIDLGSYSVIDTYTFPDGFKPKDVVYGNASDKLYFLSSNKKKIKIVNANNYSDNVTVDTLLVDNKGIDIEISEDGQYVFIPEKRTDKIAVYDALNETPADIIETGFPNVGDGVISGNYYYSSFYKYTGGEKDGGVLKINSSTRSIENVFTFPYEIDQLAATSGGELLYAVTAADSSLHIIETKTLREISSVKIGGSLKYIAVSKNNYLK